jgi:hypothetical protein
MQIDPLNSFTNDDKMVVFNKDFPKYDTTLLEIISTVAKRFDKISEAFKNIGNRDSLQQQRSQHKKMYSSPLSPERNLHDRLHTWNQNTDQPSRFNQRSSWRHGKCL